GVAHRPFRCSHRGFVGMTPRAVPGGRNRCVDHLAGYGRPRIDSALGPTFIGPCGGLLADRTGVSGASSLDLLGGCGGHRHGGGATEVARGTGFTAVVRTDPRARAGMPRPGRAEWVITARTTGVQGRDGPSRAPVVLLVSGEGWDELLPGQRVRARGVFLPAEDSPLTAALVLVRGPPARVEDPSALQSFAGGVRTRLREAVQVLPQPERGLLPALVVGDVSGVSSETAEDFRATGMTHLLTVSGANLAVLTGFVLGVARLL